MAEHNQCGAVNVHVKPDGCANEVHSSTMDSGTSKNQLDGDTSDDENTWSQHGRLLFNNGGVGSCATEGRLLWARSVAGLMSGRRVCVRVKANGDCGDRAIKVEQTTGVIQLH